MQELPAHLYPSYHLVSKEGPELHQGGPILPCQEREDILKKKYVDDLSLLEAVNLLAKLVPSPTIIGLTNIHKIPDLTLPP